MVAVKGSGIRYAKASKLLHLKRPFAFPILDRDVRETYSKRRKMEHEFWSAMRTDLVSGSNDFESIMSRLGSADEPEVSRAARLPNLRLLDILAWQMQHR
jgi:hypothetical protein